MNTRAALYLRVSTEEQAEKYGLDVQRERCEAMATVKGWEIAHTFTDDGVSGTLDESERPGLSALMTAAENGEIDAVIALSFDRLGRKTRIVLDTIDRLTAMGVEVVSCKENLDTGSPQGQFVLTIFAGLAQLERDTIVERTTAGRNARGKLDGERGGRVPLGYVRTIDDKGNTDGVAIDEGTAPIVRNIFWWRQHENTLREIAGKLNEQGIPTPRGCKWHASSVKAVLDNEDKYRGGWRGASTMRWPAILNGSRPQDC